MDESDPIPALKQQLGDELVAHIGMWNQQVAASAIGTDQPRMSDLDRNRLDRFSLETLVRFLTRIDLRVEINVVQVHASGPRMFRVPSRPRSTNNSRED